MQSRLRLLGPFDHADRDLRGTLLELRHFDELQIFIRMQHRVVDETRIGGADGDVVGHFGDGAAVGGRCFVQRIPETLLAQQFFSNPADRGGVRSGLNDPHIVA